MIGGGEPIPLLDVPAVAEVMKLIYDRPPWLRANPLRIERELYSRARAEFADVLEKRGWPLQGLAEIADENFLLRGVPIVMGE